MRCVARFLFLLVVPFAAAAAATPATAPAPDAIEARIASSDGVSLAATLRLPRGSGRHPVIILQSGAGPNKRGGYASLQRRLLDLGIASLEFDKRGVGQSTGTFTDTLGDTEADLAAAIRWLRARGDIDGRRIALLGHSLGAAAAPLVAESDGKLAAIVFLAGPVGERGTMFLQRMREQLIEGGRSQHAAEKIVRAAGVYLEGRSRALPATDISLARSHLVAAFVDGGFTRSEAEGATGILDRPQLLSLYEAAPGPALAHLRIPILAIFAGRDEFVGNPAPAAVAALAANRDALVIVVPGAGHNFVYRAADAAPRATAPGGAWLLPESLIVGWLSERLGS